MFKLDLEKAEEPEIANICWIIKKKNKKILKKPSISALLTMPKPLTVWITTNCGKFLQIGTPDDLSCLLRNLYAGQEVTVKTEHGTMDWFQIGKGIHQGCAYLTYMQSTS